MGRKNRTVDIEVRSDWGFFACSRTQEKSEHDDASTAQLLTFSTSDTSASSDTSDTVDSSSKRCNGPVTCVRPLSGEGTQLMHGGFARRMSPSGEVRR